MPATHSYPGVYIEEIPSGVRTIAGVSTSNTAFIDFFPRGPMNEAVRITSFSDFERNFGGLDRRSEASYAIKQFYLNGGQIAFVVRVASKAAAAAKPQAAQRGLAATSGSAPQLPLIVTARDPGLWGNNLQVGIDYNTKDKQPNEFNLVIREIGAAQGKKVVLRNEIHRNLSMDKGSPRYAVDAVNNNSRMVQLSEGPNIGLRPDATVPNGTDVTDSGVITDPATGEAQVGGNPNPTFYFRSLGDAANISQFPQLRSASDGEPPNDQALIDGLVALDGIAPEIFNILCLPAATNLDPARSDFDTPKLRNVVQEATKYCQDKRAFLIVDIPGNVLTPRDMSTWMSKNESIRHRNAAVYYPRVNIQDPLNEGRPRNVGPSGTLAGLYAATDASRGVWKAPAGSEVGLKGATLANKINDLENGGLNPFGINALRTFPIFGDVVWGARTLEGADIAASEWKYVPVRRTALYIEESLFEGLKWVVFEPNDETLWAQIRLNVGAYMHNLFRQGAFQGNTPSKAYLVKCDSETTTQNDIDQGVVNIVVGFAPLKPAEFVIIRIQQLAGQLQV
jgi:uncharacterized protein